METRSHTQRPPFRCNHTKRAAVALVNYELLLDNLKYFKFKKVIIQNAYLYKNSDYQPPQLVLDYFNKKNIKYIITNGKEMPPSHNFSHLFENKCSFLIGGQSWGSCVHDREYGLINTFYSGHEVYNSPLITIEEYGTRKGPTYLRFIDENYYDEDEQLSWSKSSDANVWKVDYIHKETLLKCKQNKKRGLLK